MTVTRHFIVLISFLACSFLNAQNTYVPNELLIQFKPNCSERNLIDHLASQNNIVVLKSTCISDILNIYQLQFNTDQNNFNALEKIVQSFSEVMVVQKNHYVFDRETIPSDTLFSTQWHLKNIGQTGGIVDADIDAPEAWDITTGGTTTHDDTIVVCIIEGGGVDINHDDLKANIWKNYAEIPNDGIDNDNNGYVDDFGGWHVITNNDVITSGSHGTRVSGMVGAKGNNITGVSGVNWNVKLMIVQGQQVSDEATVIAAYTYPLKMRKLYNQSNGQAGAFVVATNSSWGINNANATDHPLWCAMYDSLGAYGVLSIGATTNNDVNVDVFGDMPTTCASQFLIAVTMSNNQDLRASAGYGTTHVDIAAPGSLVRTTDAGNTYPNSSGTSFATPCVTGCVALAYSTPCPEFIDFVKNNPAQAALNMKNYIFSSVDTNPSLQTEIGTGGRINVRSTIDSILADCNTSLCVPPYNVLLSNLTDSAATISWGGFSSNYVLYIQEGANAPVEIAVLASNTFSFDTLTPCTYYTVTIKADCGLDSSDYSIPLVFQTDGCCKNPNLVLDAKTKNSLSISWNNVLYATNYDIRIKETAGSSWTEFTNVTSPFNFSGLIGCTNYEIQIYTTCDDSSHGYSASQVFITLGCGACTEKIYCSVIGANDNTEWIQSISLNSFVNNTGANNGWLQSNQIITALTPGANYPITLTPGYSGFNFTEGFSIWIDFDQNGVFEPTENIMNNQTTNSSLTSSITIPLSPQIGVTKMRIGMSSPSIPQICPTVPFYGEYEDYCVYIGPQSDIQDFERHFEIYPNPARNTLYFSSNEPLHSIQIFSIDGKLILSSSDFIDSTIDIENLMSGTYIIRATTSSGSLTSKFVKTNE